MSLFDIIRYPITNIYNDDELTALPDDLWLMWIQEVKTDEPKMSVTALLTGSRSNIVRIFQTRRMLELLQSHRDSSGAGHLIKAQMTHRLKQMIAEYEAN
jgi:hypothetical protein